MPNVIARSLLAPPSAWLALAALSSAADNPRLLRRAEKKEIRSERSDIQGESS